MTIWRSAAAFALGAASVAGFAPFHLYALPILALAFLFLLWEWSPSARAAAWLGFVFGMGFFLVGTSWIYISLHTFGGMPAALTAVATFLFCCVVALYPALAGGLSRLVAARIGQRGGGVDRAARPGDSGAAIRLLLVMPMFWTIGELLRGHLLTGFPWLGLGYSQVPESPLAGYAALLGSYGVTWLSAICAGALALLVTQWPRAGARAAWLPLAVIVAIAGAGAALRSVTWTTPSGAPISVALLQGNVAQERKFNPEVLPAIFDQYRTMVERADAKLIILPETAFPIFLHQLEPEYLVALADHAAAKGGDIVFGIALADIGAGTYYNTVVSVGISPPQAYRKRHLVPFGEYLPLRWMFAWVLEVLHMPMADFDSGPRNPLPLAVAGQHLAVSICYEDAFGADMREQLPAATALVNVSNDAWFGESLAAEQHWQIAQMRALESGRMMLRANNTGITGIIGIDGRTIGRLAPFTADMLTGELQGRAGSTPYVRWGEWGLIIALGCVGLLIMLGIKMSPRLRVSSHRPG